jgi:hypothetical protein
MHAKGFWSSGPIIQIELAGPYQSAVDHEFFSIVTGLLGTPTELIDARGVVVWQGKSRNLQGGSKGKTEAANADSKELGTWHGVEVHVDSHQGKHHPGHTIFPGSGRRATTAIPKRTHGGSRTGARSPRTTPGLARHWCSAAGVPPQNQGST